jgi:hypothetical protein
MQELLNTIYRELGKYVDGFDLHNDMIIDKIYKRIEKEIKNGIGK